MCVYNYLYRFHSKLILVIPPAMTPPTPALYLNGWGPPDAEKMKPDRLCVLQIAVPFSNLPPPDLRWKFGWFRRLANRILHACTILARECEFCNSESFTCMHENLWRACDMLWCKGPVLKFHFVPSELFNFAGINNNAPSIQIFVCTFQFVFHLECNRSRQLADIQQVASHRASQYHLMLLHNQNSIAP